MARGRGVPSTAVLVATVGVASAIYSALSLGVVAPRIFDDELIYPDAAASLTQGLGLAIRGHGYGYGPVYPLVLAAVLVAFPDRETAYALWKVANALFFALAAIPVYLLARRLLSRRASLLVAALAVAVPSSTYVSTIQTEGLAYTAAAWTLYAIVLALEKPTPARQLTAMLASLAATVVRPQLVTLYAAYVVGLVLMRFICPAVRSTQRRWIGLAPSWAPILAGTLLLGGVTVARGSFPTGVFGSYAVLWHGYSPLDVGKWVVWHSADLELYLGLVPMLATPTVLWLLVRRARAGSATHGAFASAFIAVNGLSLLTAAAFASSPFGFGRISDRYLFYVVPLWLIAFAFWLSTGAPRPWLLTATGAVSALALLAATDSGRIVVSDNAVQFQAVATELWSHLNTLSDGHGRKLMGLAALLLVVVGITLPRRRRWMLVPVLASTFAVNSAFAWHRAFSNAERTNAFVSGADRSWVDDRIGTRERAALLRFGASCGDSGLVLDSLRATEFFNSAIKLSAEVGSASRRRDELASDDLVLRPDGTLSYRSTGQPFGPAYVVTESAIELRGRRLARGTRANLALWRLDGPARVLNAHSDGALRGIICGYRAASRS